MTAGRGRSISAAPRVEWTGPGAVRRLIYPVFQDALDVAPIARVDPGLGRAARRAVEEKAFRGEAGEALTIFSPDAGRVGSVILLGLGAERKVTAEGVRRAFGTLARRSMKGGNDFTLALDAPAMEKLAVRLGNAALLDAIALSWELGGYAFDAYKTEGRRAGRKPARLLLSRGVLEQARRAKGRETPRRDSGRREAERTIERAAIVGRAVNLARDLSNTPPNDLDPERLACHAREVAREGKLGFRLLRKSDLARRGMGGILAVAQGSARPPCLIVLDYRPRRPARGTLALVGKAITFDSGGLSIKPAKGMEEMKFDMAGGAAVLGAMKAVAGLRPALRVVGIIPAAENVIGGSAMRPGDIIRSAAGKTIEVINTDAEGRLILADALHHARSFRPDHVLDFATLTGACLVALGSQVSGMFTNDEALGKEVFEAGERSGERVWKLPLYDEFVDAVKSNVADLRNSMGRNAGAITAAAFLSRFVDGLKWCHIDIAGTAWTEKETGCFAAGATGVGVRLSVELIAALEGRA
jgi:leucyl aminopeptidase